MLATISGNGSPLPPTQPTERVMIIHGPNPEHCYMGFATSKIHLSLLGRPACCILCPAVKRRTLSKVNFRAHVAIHFSRTQWPCAGVHNRFSPLSSIIVFSCSTPICFVPVNSSRIKPWHLQYLTVAQESGLCTSTLQQNTKSPAAYQTFKSSTTSRI